MTKCTNIHTHTHTHTHKILQLTLGSGRRVSKIEAKQRYRMVSKEKSKVVFHTTSHYGSLSTCVLPKESQQGEVQPSGLGFCASQASLKPRVKVYFPLGKALKVAKALDRDQQRDTAQVMLPQQTSASSREY